jgi:chromosome segregation ATPase
MTRIDEIRERLKQQLADNDLAFEHAQEVIGKQEKDNADLRAKLEKAVNLIKRWQHDVYDCDKSMVSLNDSTEILLRELEGI